MKLKLKKQQLNDQASNAESIEEKKEIIKYLSSTSVMVSLLLLSILFVRLAYMDMEQPKVVREAIAKDKSSLARRLNLALYLLTSRDARIEAEETGVKTVFNFKAVNGQFDLAGIHKVAVSLKQKYPEVFKAIMNVQQKISKKEIKKVIESIRKREKADPEIYLVDEKTGKKILLKVMFTDVVFVESTES